MGSFHIAVLLIMVGILVLRVKMKSAEEARKAARLKGMNQQQRALEIAKLQSSMANNSTSHVLHLLLSIVTGGLWLLVWAYRAHANGKKRQEIEAAMNDTIDSAAG